MAEDLVEEPETTYAKVEKPTGIALSSVGLELGLRIEVLWEVEMSDGGEEKVWWGARLGTDEEGEEGGRWEGGAGTLQSDLEADEGLGGVPRGVLGWGPIR